MHASEESNKGVVPTKLPNKGCGDMAKAVPTTACGGGWREGP